jgi:hypothetical protein
MADDDAWICADCATRRIDGNPCERCGGRKVVLISVVAEIFGNTSTNFEFDISCASWVMLRAFAVDPNGQRQAIEEYIWFLERAAISSKASHEAQFTLAWHKDMCSKCRDGLCLEGRRLRVQAEEVQRIMGVTWRTLDALRAPLEIENAKEPREPVDEE